MHENRKVVLASRPRGLPAESDFTIETEAHTAPAPDFVIIDVERISIDAFIRTTLQEDAFHGSVPLGGTVTALGVGRVVASAHDDFAEGDWVVGPTLAQSCAHMPGAAFRKIDVELAPPSAHLGLLGMTTGLTAYFGLLAVANPAAGETVVVSGAAGAVGSVVGQLARIRGARVIGIAGGSAKCAYLTDTLGLDAAIDYKGEDVAERLDALAPEGIDVFFDNVGGEVLDLVLDRLRQGARISICGAISQYDDLKNVRGPSLYLRLAERNACMCGFTVDRFADRFADATAELAGWMREGALTLPEHVETGLERFPAALAMLFTGGHTGKLLVQP